MTTITNDESDGLLRKFSRELPVILSDHECQVYGRMLAEKVREEELAEEKKKQVASDHTQRIKVIRNEIKRIADARAKGEELRPVTCGERLRGNVIEIVRIDRMEVVDTRPADLRDLQTEMPLPEHGDESPIDEGPRGDEFGGPDKTGRGIEVVRAGEVAHAGGAPEASDDILLCDACGELVGEDDETVEVDGSTVHARCKPDDEADDQRPALTLVGDETPDEEPKPEANGRNGVKPTRERSKAKNAAKGKPAPKRKR